MKRIITAFSHRWGAELAIPAASAHDFYASVQCSMFYHGYVFLLNLRSLNYWRNLSSFRKVFKDLGDNRLTFAEYYRVYPRSSLNASFACIYSSLACETPKSCNTRHRILSCSCTSSPHKRAPSDPCS